MWQNIQHMHAYMRLHMLGETHTIAGISLAENSRNAFAPPPVAGKASQLQLHTSGAHAMHMTQAQTIRNRTHNCSWQAE
jgi:hypothetical protein